jgi:hypothetical protein
VVLNSAGEGFVADLRVFGRSGAEVHGKLREVLGKKVNVLNDSVSKADSDDKGE